MAFSEKTDFTAVSEVSSGGVGLPSMGSLHALPACDGFPHRFLLQCNSMKVQVNGPVGVCVCIL